MTRQPLRVVKPKALQKGSRLAFFAPASPPADFADLRMGLVELQRLGFDVVAAHEVLSEGYFAASTDERLEGFLNAVRDPEIAGLVAVRGGYGSTYLLDLLSNAEISPAKCVIGYSDLTALHTYLWRKHGWVCIYGPMLVAGFDHGPNDLHGFDESSFLQAVSNTTGHWTVHLGAETLVNGEAEGTLLGGCLTILQTSIGTPWELDTEGAILLLEDTHMKPYQVDRALMHLMQAGKLKKVRAIILGDFPDSKPTVSGSPTVRDVCERILVPLGVPIIFGAPIGHTTRPMLTIPLGVRAKLHADGEGKLEILEPAVVQ